MSRAVLDVATESPLLWGLLVWMLAHGRGTDTARQAGWRVMRAKRQSTPSMHQSLPSLLFPEYWRRVLRLLLRRPDEARHGREIARRTGLPASAITCELGKLAKRADSTPKLQVAASWMQFSYARSGSVGTSSPPCGSGP